MRPELEHLHLREQHLRHGPAADWSVRQRLDGDLAAERTGKTHRQIYDESDRDYWMRADKAQEYSLIDKVLTRQPA